VVGIGLGVVRSVNAQTMMFFLRPYYNSCDRPQCPKCYRSWAVRAGWLKIAPRLLEASKLFGLHVEHIICSLPKDDYGLVYIEAKRKAVRILGSCSVFGGVIIPHGNRIDKSMGVEFFSPHHDSRARYPKPEHII